MQYTYTIPLKPMPLQRARHVWKNLRPFDPQKQDKLAYGITLQSQKPNIPPISCPIRLEAYFYFKIADSRIKQATRENWKYHYFKPDISNCIKFIEDICVDISILHDDCIIAEEMCWKLWTFDNARTVFTITELL